MAALTAELASLRAENARLLRLLKLTRREAAPPGPAQAGFFEAPPGAVHAGSPPEVKVAFFGALFAARTDLYAVRWENARTGQKGWFPAVRGGWRKGVPHAERDYLPLTAGVLSAHLSGRCTLACIRFWTVIDAGGWPPTSMAARRCSTRSTTSRLPELWACQRAWRCHGQGPAPIRGSSSPARSRRRRRAAWEPACCVRRWRCAAR